MGEKRTFGGFIKENKGKIIKGSLILIGVTVGIVLVYKTIKTGTSIEKDGLDILDTLTDGLSEGAEVLGDATNIIS
jgi:hypothetical protein